MNLDGLVEYAQEEAEDAMPPHADPARTQLPKWIDTEAVILLQEGDDTDANAVDAVGVDAHGYAVVPLLPSDEILVEPTDPGAMEVAVPSMSSQEIKFRGPDALAFYLPFHFYRRPWGIYLRASGICYLSAVLAGQESGTQLPVDRADLPEMARSILFEHEYQHFTTEVGATLCEVSLRERRYPEFFRDYEATSVEEAVCNAAALTLLDGRKNAVLRRELRKWMARQGDGYSEFPRYKGRKRFATGQRKLTDHILSTSLRRRGNPPPASMPQQRATVWPGETLLQSVRSCRLKTKVPTYMVIDQTIPWFRVARLFPKAGGVLVKVHTNDHQPPHIHVFMPPDYPFGKYTWPGLEPSEQDRQKSPYLSGKDRKRLVGYLTRYGKDICRKLREVYGPYVPEFAEN